MKDKSIDFMCKIDFFATDCNIFLICVFIIRGAGRDRLCGKIWFDSVKIV